jgi:hypothetical protein
MFSDIENKLLAIAYQTILPRMHILEVLGDRKWGNTGMENWVQTELIVGLDDNGFDITTVGNRRKNCDIIIKSGSDPEIRLEIEAVTRLSPSYVSKNIQNHMSRNQKPDLFLVLGKELRRHPLSEFYQFLGENGYEEIHETLPDGWVLMLLKKIHNPKVQCS